MKYSIKITYITGNSFGSEETYSILDLTWDDLDNAKRNLQAIEEHWRYYNEVEEDGQNLVTTERYKHKFWYVNKYPEEFFRHHLIKLRADNGGLMQMNCFWTGYFENLIGAEIVMPIDESDLSFTI